MFLTARSTDGAGGPQHYRAAGTEFTVGRGADCDWTLPDPTRQLSKRHCRMVVSQGQWRLTDLSSNGMTLNDRTVTPGVSHTVRDGDRLGMGSYDITLSIETAFDAPTGDQDGSGNSPFDRPRQDDYQDGRQNGREDGRLIGDPFTSPANEIITDPFDVALSPLFGQPDERPARQAGGPSDGFGSGFKGGGSSGDDVSALNEPFEPPRPGHLLLPPDWDEPLHPGPPTAAAAIDAPQAPPPAIEVAPPARSSPQPAPTIPDPPPPTATVDETYETARHPRQTDAPDDATARAFAAFARGAGLQGMPHEAPEQALENLGRAFRAYVVGLRRLLIARATVKGEFRIDRTMIRPFGNNPIKFATDDNDALAALLGIGRQVGMTAEQAVADSVRDVRSHELALNEAFQHAMRELVSELSPEQVAAGAQPGPFDAVPVLRNSRRWTLFELRHARLRASLETSMDSVFGQSFARGYEAALARLSDADPDDFASQPGRDA